MSNVYPFPEPPEDPTDEACDWLARLERGLTEEEDHDLRNWLAASPKRVQALLETAGLWDRMDSLSRLADLFPKPVPQPTRHPRLYLALAASLLAVAVALFTTLRLDADREPSDGMAIAGYQQQFETAIGEHSTIRLPDGSELTLNTNSRVHADFGNGARRLTLEKGEVFVKVAHDERRPLTVWAGDGIVRAVGTAFNVEITDDKQVEVIVTEGRVMIGVDKSKATESETAWLEKVVTPVVAGQRVLLGDEEPAVKEIGADEIDVKLSWREGNLIFHGEPLAEALGEIGRYTRVEFIIRDEELKAIRVAGLFKAGDVDGLLATLRENFNVSYERVGTDKIVLKGE